jgi:hypothetical protein
VVQLCTLWLYKYENDIALPYPYAIYCHRYLLGGVHFHSGLSSVWWLPAAASASGKAALEDCIFGVASRVQSHDFLGLKPKVRSLLFVPGNSLVNDIVLWVQTFWRMKNLRSSIGRRQLLCIVFFLEALLLDKIFCSLRIVLGGGYSAANASD